MTTSENGEAGIELQGWTITDSSGVCLAVCTASKTVHLDWSLRGGAPLFRIDQGVGIGLGAKAERDTAYTSAWVLSGDMPLDVVGAARSMYKSLAENSPPVQIAKVTRELRAARTWYDRHGRKMTERFLANQGGVGGGGGGPPPIAT